MDYPSSSSSWSVFQSCRARWSNVSWGYLWEQRLSCILSKHIVLLQHALRRGQECFTFDQTPCHTFYKGTEICAMFSGLRGWWFSSCDWYHQHLYVFYDPISNRLLLTCSDFRLVSKNLRGLRWFRDSNQTMLSVLSQNDLSLSWHLCIGMHP